MTIDELDRMTSAEILDLLERIGGGWVTTERGLRVLEDRKLTDKETCRLEAVRAGLFNSKQG